MTTHAQNKHSISTWKIYNLNMHIKIDLTIRTHFLDEYTLFIFSARQIKPSSIQAQITENTDIMKLGTVEFYL